MFGLSYTNCVILCALQCISMPCCRFIGPCVQIGEISKPILIDWVISHHTHILEWTERAFDIEVSSILHAICYKVSIICLLVSILSKFKEHLFKTRRKVEGKKTRREFRVVMLLLMHHTLSNELK